MSKKKKTKGTPRKQSARRVPTGRGKKAGKTGGKTGAPPTPSASKPTANVSPKAPAKPDPSSARLLRGGPLPVDRATTELAPKELRWTCPPIASGDRQPGLATLLGQDRPVTAIKTGLALYAPGFNIYVSGTVGSGRTRLITDLIRKLKPAGKLVPDRVFVTNFREPNRPRLVTVPRGKGPEFRDDTHELVHRVQDALRAALSSRIHRVSHDLVLRSAEEREKRLMAALDRQVRKVGFSVVQFPGTNGGMIADIYPIHEGEAINLDAFPELVSKGEVSHTKYLKLRARRDQLMDRLEEVTERLLKLGKETDDELRKIDEQVARRLLKTHLRSFARQWDNPEIDEFLEGLQDYILRDIERWVADDPQHEADAHGVQSAESRPSEKAQPVDGPSQELESLPPPPPSVQPPAGRGDPVRFLGVEVHVVRTSTGEDCPVVLETHPTYSNLFGVVESSRDGHIPSLGQMHPGSLLRADGGYLILRLSELMSEPGVWTQLKRAVRVGRVEIREFDPNSGVTSGTLQPEAVPITLKVILIGDLGSYETLAVEDGQFLQTFKIHAEFDTVIPATKANMRRYADLLDWFRRQEGLLPFSSEANAAVVEFGARTAGRKDMLTARYGELADLAREASHICAIAGESIISRAHIEQAIRMRTYRSDLPRECVERDYQDGYLLVSTKGEAVGQINALTVLESDAIMFGKPSRVTVATGAGPLNRSGLVNIEREADLSGPLHDKGVMILHGYLLNQFAAEAPLNLQATICFEQTYGGVDGDSASSAELCALLSSLTDIPIDQSFGVTGSINQLGAVQAVSAVNEKIEGFFRLCRFRGSRHRAGVVMPRANVPDLMLDPEVVAAVEAGRFAIHAVDHIDEMMEILTGVPMAEIKAAAATRLKRYRG